MAVFGRYLTTLEVAANAFYNHHQDNNRDSAIGASTVFSLNGLIQPSQQPARSRILQHYRQLYPVSRDSATPSEAFLDC